MGQLSRVLGAVIGNKMFDFFVASLFYFFYQATLGGLFLLVSRNLTSTQYAYLLSSLLLVAEPLLMLVFGVFAAKKIDFIKKHPHYNNAKSYVVLALMTASSFIFFYYFFSILHFVSVAIFFYFAVIFFLMLERIYRQRFSRDFSDFYKLPIRKINAIGNLAGRGAPLCVPLVLFIFPLGVTSTYLYCFFVVITLSTFSFYRLYNRISHKTSLLSQTSVVSENTAYANKLGVWHGFHLMVMNFAFGPVFLVLSQPILANVTVNAYLQSPLVFYIGFFVALIFISFQNKTVCNTPLRGVRFIFLMGIVFALVPQVETLYAGLLLGLAGVLFALSVNRIGSHIQYYMDREKYSYYETKAQTYGRVAAICSIGLFGWLLQIGISYKYLEFICGFFMMGSAVFLSVVYKYLGLSVAACSSGKNKLQENLK